MDGIYYERLAINDRVRSGNSVMHVEKADMIDYMNLRYDILDIRRGSSRMYHFSVPYHNEEQFYRDFTEKDKRRRSFSLMIICEEGYRNVENVMRGVMRRISASELLPGDTTTRAVRIFFVNPLPRRVETECVYNPWV